MSYIEDGVGLDFPLSSCVFPRAWGGHILIRFNVYREKAGRDLPTLGLSLRIINEIQSPYP